MKVDITANVSPDKLSPGSYHHRQKYQPSSYHHRQNSPSGCYNYSSGRGKLLVPPPEAAFFRKSVSPLTEKQEVQEALKVLLGPYLSFVTISLNNNRTHS